MRKYVSTTMLIIVCLMSFTCVTAVSFADTAIYVSADSYWEAFVEDNPYRLSGSASEAEAAAWLADELYNMGYGGSGVAADMISEFTFEVKTSSGLYEEVADTYTSQNVAAYKSCGREDAKLVVVGSCYDSVSSSASYGTGAYYATGVGAVLNIASRLCDENLTFDVAFVFYGGSMNSYECGNVFLDNCGYAAEDILMCINFYGVGGGENSYVYYDEVGRTHGEFFDGIISQTDADILDAPFNKQPSVAHITPLNLPYSHIGILSENATFMSKGVPSVNFLGACWEELGGTSEYKGSSWISGTNNDTVAGILAAGGETEVRKRMQDACDVTVNAIKSDNFVEIAVSSRQDSGYGALNNSKLFKYLSYGFLALIVVAFAIVYSYLKRNQKKAERPVAAQSGVFVDVRTGAVYTPKPKDEANDNRDIYFSGKSSEDGEDTGDENAVGNSKEADKAESSKDDDIFGF